MFLMHPKHACLLFIYWLVSQILPESSSPSFQQHFYSSILRLKSILSQSFLFLRFLLQVCGASKWIRFNFLFIHFITNQGFKLSFSIIKLVRPHHPQDLVILKAAGRGVDYQGVCISLNTMGAMEWPPIIDHFVVIGVTHLQHCAATIVLKKTALVRK